MVIQFASDLHLEIPVNLHFLIKNPLIKSSDVLVLAGDIFYLSESHYPNEILDSWEKEFEKVFIVPGNHEFYGKYFPIANSFPSLRLKLRDNIEVVNNIVEFLDGCRILFTTLFTRIAPEYALKIKRSLGDFRYSKLEKSSMLNLTIDKYNYSHRKCRAFLEMELAQSYNGKTIIVSHHSPINSRLIKGYPHDYNGFLNSAFHVDLSMQMKNRKVDHWISGHTHFNHHPIRVHDTICHTNQLGYLEYGENRNFSSSKTLSIS